MRLRITFGPNSNGLGPRHGRKPRRYTRMAGGRVDNWESILYFTVGDQPMSFRDYTRLWVTDSLRTNNWSKVREAIAAMEYCGRLNGWDTRWKR